MRLYNELPKKKGLDAPRVMHCTWLNINRVIFFWYYNRVPVFFHKWTILKSIALLTQNYEHAIYLCNESDKLIKSASNREIEMRQKISNLELKLRGVSQEKIDPINKMFGTSLKGVSRDELAN